MDGFDGDAAIRAAEDRLLRTKDFDAAWKILLSAFEADPQFAGEYAEARENPGLNPDRARRKPKLLRILDRAVAKNPRLAPPRAWRALLRRQLLDYAGAAADLSRAWKQGLRTAAVLTWRGEALLHAFEPERGLADMKAALRRRDSAAWNWAWCGRALLNQFRDPRGESYLDRAVRLAPRWGKAYAWRGEARRHRRDLSGMLADFNRALRLKPDDSLRHFVRGLRGLGLLQMGRLEEAARELRRTRGAAPDRALWVHGLAVAARRSGRLGEWIELLDRAAKIDVKYERHVAAFPPDVRERMLEDLDSLVASEPRNAAARRWRGRTLLAGGRPAEAEDDFAAACRAQPKSAKAWLGRCESLLAQPGRLDDSKRALARAARLDRRSAEAFLIGARLALASGDAPQALARYERAIKIEPLSLPANAELGSVLLSLGRIREALSPLDKAAKIGRTEVSPLVDLSAARRLSGDAAGAAEAWRKALKIDPAQARRRAGLWNVAEPREKRRTPKRKK